MPKTAKWYREKKTEGVFRIPPPPPVGRGLILSDLLTRENAEPRHHCIYHSRVGIHRSVGSWSLDSAYTDSYRDKVLSLPYVIVNMT